MSDQCFSDVATVSEQQQDPCSSEHRDIPDFKLLMIW
uniref:Uncharacterized protein n=1 Tax=Anguilla anguilla TaxID=7936 RepID=A0A0E9SXS3_ANGAN